MVSSKISTVNPTLIHIICRFLNTISTPLGMMQLADNMFGIPKKKLVLVCIDDPVLKSRIEKNNVVAYTDTPNGFFILVPWTFDGWRILNTIGVYPSDNDMIQLADNIFGFPEEGWVLARIDDPVLQASIMKANVVAYSDTQNGFFVQVPWSVDGCQFLMAIGVPSAIVVAPILYGGYPLVEGKYKPFQHQLLTAAFVTANPRCYVLSDPRTGKTGSLIMAMKYLQNDRHITSGVLIITTVTTIRSVWEEGIRSTIPDAVIEIVNGKDREAALARPADFYITNYDSVRVSTQAFMDAVKDKRIGACVIDELTHVANPSSQRHKTIYAVVNKCNLKYVVGVTGSPGCDPEAVWGMGRMINPSKLPCTTKSRWMDLVTVSSGMDSWKRKPSPEAPKIIHNALMPAIRFNKNDVLDLPPVTNQTRQCEMSSDQLRMYKAFRNEAVALAKSGEVITAANGGVKLQKIMQVAQGFCNDNDGEAIILDHEERTRTIIEAIEETDHKIVIFGCYKKTIAMRKAELENAGYTVGVIDGSVGSSERARLLHDFQYEQNPHVIICHPTTTAFGVEMSAADTMIFDGPPLLGGFIFAQALERLSSSKQTANNINVIRIVACPEERKLFRALDSGQEISKCIAELFEQLQ